MPATATPAADRLTVPVQPIAEHITVGTDGSYWGDIAVSWAARHAWLSGMDLRVLRPVADSGPSGDVRLNAAARRYPLLPIVWHAVEGRPLTDLASASASSQLVVLGCRGDRHPRLGLGDLILPTIEVAQCDVAVIRGAPAAVQGEHRSIAVLISGGTNDAVVLQRAAAAADTYRSRLEVVHAVARYGPHSADTHNILTRAALQLSSIAPGIAVTTRLAWALPHEVIERIDHTDLIVLGRGDSRRTSAHPGAVTKGALFHAPCPVLVVHPSP